MVARVIYGMIPLGGRSKEVRKAISGLVKECSNLCTLCWAFQQRGRVKGKGLVPQQRYG